MDGTVPDDIAREKQRDLGQQLATAQSQRAKLQATSTMQEVAIRRATDLVVHAMRLISVSGITPQGLQPSLVRPTRLPDRKRATSHRSRPPHRTPRSPPHCESTRSRSWPTVRVSFGGSMCSSRFWLVRPLSTETPGTDQKKNPGTFRYRVTSCVRGSNFATLVGDTGIEPVTPTVSR
jgi:hypothetical protein